MNEKEAREIVRDVESAPAGVERFNRMAQNYQFRYALGFLAGIEAERKRARPIISSVGILIESLMPGMEDCSTNEITLHHLSGGLITCGPVVTTKFIGSIKRLRESFVAYTSSDEGAGKP